MILSINFRRHAKHERPGADQSGEYHPCKWWTRTMVTMYHHPCLTPLLFPSRNRLGGVGQGAHTLLQLLTRNWCFLPTSGLFGRLRRSFPKLQPLSARPESKLPKLPLPSLSPAIGRGSGQTVCDLPRLDDQVFVSLPLRCWWSPEIGPRSLTVLNHAWLLLGSSWRSDCRRIPTTYRGVLRRQRCDRRDSQLHSMKEGTRRQQLRCVPRN